MWEPSFFMRAEGLMGRQTDRQTDRQSDRHDEANSRFSQFCESAYIRETINKPSEMYNISQNEQELPQ